MTRQPISKKIKGLRQRKMASGWRVWWEPNKSERELGFGPAELDPDKPTWSARRAETLNELAAETKAPKSPNQEKPAKPKRGTVSELIARYRASPDWKAKRPATQRDYMIGHNRIEKKWGDYQLTHFDKPIIRRWYETLFEENGETIALQLIRHFSVLFTYGELIGMCANNPCHRLKLKQPIGRDRVLTWDEYDMLVSTALELGEPEIAVAMTLGTLQGQRETDILNATWDQFEDGKWHLVRSKRGGRGTLLLHEEANDRLKDLRQHRSMAGNAETKYVMDRDAKGAPMTVDRFNEIFSKVRAAATKQMPGLKDMQFRDTRRTFGTWARGDASERDVADALGNSAYKDPNLSGRYMIAEERTAARALRAIQRPNKKEAS